MKKSALLFALPLFGMVMTGCEKKNDTVVVEPSITLNKTTLLLDAGASETLVATVANGEGAVTWSSSNPAAISVDANGVVTAGTEGSATITATYSGKTATCTVRVKGLTDYYALAAVQDNENIKDFKNNVANENHEFKGQTDPILQVGDDNPVDVKPVLKILDLTDMSAAPQDVWDFDYELKLELNGESYAEVDKATYGTFDAKNCTFDFNEAAIGKQFKLTVTPGGLTDAQKADPLNSKSVELKVNNGYNVYTADELAYFNDINFLDYNRQSNHPENVNVAWVLFRAAHNLDSTYVAPSIYLQKTIKITRANIPDVFFYTAAEAGGNADWVGKMKDCSDIYCHYADGFEFNGNYFHIDTTEVPVGQDDPGLGYDDNVSHSTLFKVAYLGNQVATRTVLDLSFKNCSYLGNAARGNDETNAMGLIFFKIQNGGYNNNVLVQATFDNFNVKAACISFFAEVGETKMIVKDCVVQEGYSNGFYLWNNGIVDIENSEFRNFGGPVFITDGDDTDTVVGFSVTADEATVFDNWVTGSEPWFANTKGGGPATAIPNIKALQGYVGPISQAFGTPRTFVKEVEGTQFMNMIIINYGEIPDVIFKKGNGNVIGINQESERRAELKGILDNEGMFVLNTDNGGFAKVSPDPNNPSYSVLAPGTAFGGNYLDMLGKMAGFGYLSLVFEFYFAEE